MKIYWQVLPIVFLLLITANCGSGPSATANSGQGKKGGKVDELDLAIRNASDYLNENIPKGSKIVILNIESASVDLSNYIIDELVANAIKDKVFSVVDRKQLDTIRAEQKFQLSGEVNDKTALAIGKFVGAQTIVSGAVSRLGGGYRISIRALEVQTAQVQGQFNRNIASSVLMNTLMATAGSPTAPVEAAPSATDAIVSGNSLAAKLAWLKRNAKNNNTYIIEVTANESIAPPAFEWEGAANITVVFRGDKVNRTVTLQSNGTYLVKPGVTFVLDNNITLQGRGNNTNAVVDVYGGNLKMNAGSAITGNSRCGVFLAYGGTFEMNGGTISGNADEFGGGVQVFNDGAAFTMNGGTITGNTANKGGGVFINYGCFFTMRGGTIASNTALEFGGGVCAYGLFSKTGGTVTAYNVSSNNGNVAKDASGNILTRKGHGVFVSDTRRKETTAGQAVNLDSNSSKGWDK
jgi:TolB-like protein